MSLAGLFAAGTVTSPFHLLKPSASLITHPSAWRREEKCVAHQAEQRQPIWGRETVRKQICSEQSEAGVCKKTPSESGQELFQSTGIQGPERPLSVTQDMHRKLMFTEKRKTKTLNKVFTERIRWARKRRKCGR